MNANVIEYEPAKALFVPDNDPLKFYNCIAVFSNEALADNGALFFEINEAFASEVTKLLEKNNFHKIELVKDINGKDRFVYGLKAG
jgi:release factor glutamine methyltransferase